MSLLCDNCYSKANSVAVKPTVASEKRPAQEPSVERATLSPAKDAAAAVAPDTLDYIPDDDGYCQIDEIRLPAIVKAATTSTISKNADKTQSKGEHQGPSNQKLLQLHILALDSQAKTQRKTMPTNSTTHSPATSATKRRASRKLIHCQRMAADKSPPRPTITLSMITILITIIISTLIIVLMIITIMMIITIIVIITVPIIILKNQRMKMISVIQLRIQLLN